jgi:hypothetical protein
MPIRPLSFQHPTAAPRPAWVNPVSGTQYFAGQHLANPHYYNPLAPVHVRPLGHTGAVVRDFLAGGVGWAAGAGVGGGLQGYAAGAVATGAAKHFINWAATGPRAQPVAPVYNPVRGVSGFAI